MDFSKFELCYYIYCSSDQTYNSETTNPEFFARKYFSLLIFKELQNKKLNRRLFVDFDFKTKVRFEQIKTNNTFWNKNSGFVDS